MLTSVGEDAKHLYVLTSIGEGINKSNYANLGQRGCEVPIRADLDRRRHKTSPTVSTLIGEDAKCLYVPTSVEEGINKFICANFDQRGHKKLKRVDSNQREHKRTKCADLGRRWHIIKQSSNLTPIEKDTNNLRVSDLGQMTMILLMTASLIGTKP